MPDTLLSNTASESTLDDRQRPGRVAVDEALIPILRNPAGDGECSSKPTAEQDDAYIYDMIESIFPRRLSRSIAMSLGMWGVILVGLIVVLR